MAINIISDSIENGEGRDSEGKRSFTRKILFSKENTDPIPSLMESDLFPSYGDAHPNHSDWYVSETPTVEPHSDSRFLVTAKYSREESGMDGSLGGSSVLPWEMPPQNVNVSFFEHTVPMTVMYSKNGDNIPVANTAGCAIAATKNVSIMQISFEYNLEHKTGTFPTLAAEAIINRDPVRILSYDIPSTCGKLMPMSSVLNTVKKNNGTIKYQYNTIKATIQVKLDGWKRELLNVGTLANWGGPLAQWGTKIGPIYQYKKNAEQVIPSWGDIFAVQKARAEAKEEADSKKKELEFSYVEITEPMPLQWDGSFFEEAITDPKNNPYLKISGYESIPASWEIYKFPKEM